MSQPKIEAVDTTHRVFVYGTLKKGGGNHRLLTSSKFVSKAQMAGTMYHLGGFPCIKTNGKNAIYGELYDVDDETFARLDRLEGYPGFYDRSKVETSKGPAWVYTMDHRADTHFEHTSVISSGVWPVKAETEEDVIEAITAEG